MTNDYFLKEFEPNLFYSKQPVYLKLKPYPGHSRRFTKYKGQATQFVETDG